MVSINLKSFDRMCLIQTCKQSFVLSVFDKTEIKMFKDICY